MPGLHVPRWLRASLALIVVIALVGATYQGVATALERRTYPHPGRLIDVGGHQLHIFCEGTGRPAVVLEAPASGLSASWRRVQDNASKTTRVCSYDRAGLGWSERGDSVYDPAQIPVELQRLLAGAAERPPFVVAGAGLGAVFARMFAERFPQLTAALVEIDPPAPDRDSADRRSLGRFPAAAPWLARVGLLRLASVETGREPGPMHAFMNRPDHLTRSAIELSKWDDAVRDHAGPAPSRSVAVALDAPVSSERGGATAVAAITQTIADVRRAAR